MEEDFLTEIYIVGEDQFGKWTAKGFIMAKTPNMYIWFYKEYNDRAKAGQLDQWKHLIYESTNINTNGEIQGRWFYEGF